MSTRTTTNPNADCALTKGQLRTIRGLLTDRNLIAETRPAYRHRMQVLKSNPRMLFMLTWGQAEALIKSLYALPIDESIEHTAWVSAVDGHITASDYEDRCAETIGRWYGHGMRDFGALKHHELMSFTY